MLEQADHDEDADEYLNRAGSSNQNQQVIDEDARRDDVDHVRNPDVTASGLSIINHAFPTPAKARSGAPAALRPRSSRPRTAEAARANRPFARPRNGGALRRSTQDQVDWRNVRIPFDDGPARNRAARKNADRFPGPPSASTMPGKACGTVGETAIAMIGISYSTPAMPREYLAGHVIRGARAARTTGPRLGARATSLVRPGGDGFVDRFAPHRRRPLDAQSEISHAFFIVSRRTVQSCE